MTISALRAARELMRVDEDQLRAVRRELEITDADVVVARANLVTASDALENAEAIHAEKKAQETFILASLSKHRHAASAMRLMTDDILRAIFVACVGSVLRDFEFCDRQSTINGQRMRLGLVLSSVCREWRRVAISTRFLWSYIGVDLNKCQLPCHYQAATKLVSLYLERSNPAQLDVAALGIPSQWTSLCPGVIASITSHARRLRSLVLRFPALRDAVDITRYLSVPFPSLLSFSLESERLIKGVSNRTFSLEPLAAPKLNMLSIWDASIETQFFDANRYANVTTLYLKTVGPYTTILAILKACPKVKTLHLAHFEERDNTPAPTSQEEILLSLCTSMSLDMSSTVAKAVAQLSAPRLRDLTVKSNETRPGSTQLTALINNLGTRLSSITFKGRTLCTVQAAALHSIPRLQNLRLDTSEISSEFFAHLKSLSLPSLNVIHILPNSSLDSSAQHALVRYIESVCYRAPGRSNRRLKVVIDCDINSALLESIELACQFNASQADESEYLSDDGYV